VPWSSGRGERRWIEVAVAIREIQREQDRGCRTDPYFQIAGAAEADNKPSIVPAINSSVTTAPIMRAAMRPSTTSASLRVRSPGAIIALANRKPAPAEMKIAVSSSTPWPRTKVRRYFSA